MRTARRTADGTSLPPLKTRLAVVAVTGARRLWKAAPLPPAVRGVAARPLYALSLMAGKAGRRAAAPGRIVPGAVVVSGFHSGVLGVGLAARATGSALEAAGLHPVLHEIDPVLRSEPFQQARLPVGEGGVWIQHCNAPENDLLFSHLLAEGRRARYRIGYWAWELESLPPRWRRSARAFHEIWVPSLFVAEAVRPHAACVRVMPHPLRRSPPARPDRARYGLAEAAVVFGAFADVRSSLARKNPLAAIEAYRLAFPVEDGRTALSLKVVAAEDDPAGVAALHARAAGRGDIRVWAGQLGDADMARYLAGLDVVVSLHRSEGFGLVLAESYLAGKAAIATGWSGNLDFTPPTARAWLVPHRLVAVHDPQGRYRGGRWAEPDIAAAAALMRSAAADPARRRLPDGEAQALERQLQAPWTAEALATQPGMRFSARRPA